jgi:hypothetical protein
MTPAAFAQTWAGNTRTERAASQEHFIDLSRMLDRASDWLDDHSLPRSR